LVKIEFFFHTFTYLVIKQFKPRFNSVKPISQAKVAHETLCVGRFIYTLNLPTVFQQMFAKNG